MNDKKYKKQNKNDKVKKSEKPEVPGNWLYFAPQEMTVRDIYQIFEIELGHEIEIWEDAGVLEIALQDGNSFDMEEAEIHPKDEITNEFAKKNDAKSVFLSTFSPESYEAAKKIMERIIAEKGGFFCGDTENFEPVISGK